MSNRPARWFQSDTFFPKRNIDDVLMLNTGENLEMHAHSAAEEAGRQLDTAEKHEQKVGEELAEVQTKYKLATASLTNTERLSQSVISILNRVRSK